MYLVVDRKFVFLMFISLLSNYIRITETAINNNMDSNSKSQRQNSSMAENYQQTSYDPFDPIKCEFPNTECSKIHSNCIKCAFDNSCLYGEMSNVTCEVKNGVQCEGPKQFYRQFTCRYCFLTDHWEHDCQHKWDCNSVHSTYKTNCTVRSEVLCLGNRQFQKHVKCNWSRGSKYFTALFLSVTLGGFGVDRFYLGHWQEGIGKLFSFGGLGVWVIVDAILISIGFLGTSDGSLLL